MTTSPSATDLHTAIRSALPDPEAITGPALAAVAADVTVQFPGVPVGEVRRAVCLLAVGSAEELDEEQGVEPPGATDSPHYDALVAVAEDAVAEANRVWAGHATA